MADCTVRRAGPMGDRISGGSARQRQAPPASRRKARVPRAAWAQLSIPAHSTARASYVLDPLPRPHNQQPSLAMRVPAPRSEPPAIGGTGGEAALLVASYRAPRRRRASLMLAWCSVARRMAIDQYARFPLDGARAPAAARGGGTRPTLEHAS
mmetsp:Transcript_27631/g.63555  ORF Transcript_27631/g.63555 Transcript_27631/m.63555 type:complete len:153 (+) Transcript_27631:194-652(+)